MSGLTSKKHSVYDLYHEDCEQFVTGNGSMVFPYTCACGTWSYFIETYSWQLNVNSNDRKEG